MLFREGSGKEPGKAFELDLGRRFGGKLCVNPIGNARVRLEM